MKRQWDLSGIIPPLQGREYEALLQGLEGEVKSLEGVRGRLDNFSGADLLEVIKIKERAADIKSRLGAYAYLWFSGDTHDSEARAFLSKMENLSAEISNRTLFFSLWFKGLDDVRAAGLMKAVPVEYQYLLTRVRETRPYALQESEEKIINLKDISGSSALVKLYDMITSSFSFTLEVEGKKRVMTQEELRNYAQNPDPRLRAAAYRELLAVFGDHGQVLGELYRAIATDWKNENLTLRKYRNAAAVKNVANDIPEEAYDALLKTVRRKTSFFQEYFELKFKACGVEEFSRYHLYAPYEAKEKKYPYEDAVRMVLENFHSFSPRMAGLAENVVKMNHIDVDIRKGKRSGAYCYPVSPTVVPYVLLNYNETVRNVFTLAHELGHAVHDQLASKHSVLNFRPPLPLAETASIFSETVLFDKVFAAEKDTEVRKGLLIAKLDDVYASVGRQVYFTVFEEVAHRMVADGAGVDELKKEYYRQMVEQFGRMSVPQEFEWEWTYIPHIYHSPFYCYSYAFGNLLVLSLYERYKEEGQGFIPQYLKILEYGGSERPQKVLEEVGFDICSPKFWESGFEIIGRMVSDLKELR